MFTSCIGYLFLWSQNLINTTTTTIIQSTGFNCLASCSHAGLFPDSTRSVRCSFSQIVISSSDKCSVSRSPPTCSTQVRRAGVRGTTQPLACVPGGRLRTCVCHWTPTTAFIGYRHVPSAANQQTFWRSLIRCCWTSSMEQSAAARVRHYTRTILTSTQNASTLCLKKKAHL